MEKNKQNYRGIVERFLDWLFPAIPPEDDPYYRYDDYYDKGMKEAVPAFKSTPTQPVTTPAPAACSTALAKPAAAPVTPPVQKANTVTTPKHPSYVSAAPTTTYTDHRTARIEVKKEALVEDNSGLGSILPSTFYVEIPTELSSVIGFARRAMHVLECKSKVTKGLYYTVIAAPVDSSLKTSANVMVGLKVRAVFITSGNELLYRVEALKNSSSNPDMVEEEFCTYDISNALAYYASDAATTATFY